MEELKLIISNSIFYFVNRLNNIYTNMEILFILAVIIGLILILLGFVGCIIPALPGPPLAFIALLILKLTDPTVFTTKFIFIIGAITVVVYFLDYILPIMGAKMYKASKQGIWFSIIGMLIGMFFFPPFGMILGLLLGAILGELISGKARAEAIKIGFVSFGFSLLSIFIKILLTGVMAFYFIEAVFEYYT